MAISIKKRTYIVNSLTASGENVRLSLSEQSTPDPAAADAGTGLPGPMAPSPMGMGTELALTVSLEETAGLQVYDTIVVSFASK